VTRTSRPPLELSLKRTVSPDPRCGIPSPSQRSRFAAWCGRFFFRDGQSLRNQVVLSPVDSETDISSICMQVGLALSAQVQGTTCLVEANLNSPGLEQIVEKNGHDLIANQKTAVFRDPSCQLSNELWLIPRSAFVGENETGFSGGWLRDRLTELRHTFDYTILYGPPAAVGSEAALLASLCDGLVLVVEANSTRRVAAQKVKEKLHAANARLLGAVLSERTFPIPEVIYRNL
jgi:protein-tyrosine kinase